VILAGVEATEFALIVVGRERERIAGEQTSDGEASCGSCVEREERGERDNISFSFTRVTADLDFFSQKDGTTNG